MTGHKYISYMQSERRVGCEGGRQRVREIDKGRRDSCGLDSTKHHTHQVHYLSGEDSDTHSPID